MKKYRVEYKMIVRDSIEISAKSDSKKDLISAITKAIDNIERIDLGEMVLNSLDEKTIEIIKSTEEEDDDDEDDDDVYRVPDSPEMQELENYCSEPIDWDKLYSNMIKK